MQVVRTRGCFYPFSLSLSFGPSSSSPSLDKLDEMVEAINATTRAEVIRRALTLFTEVMAAEERGAKIFFREKDGTMIQVMPLF